MAYDQYYTGASDRCSARKSSDCLRSEQEEREFLRMRMQFMFRMQACTEKIAIKADTGYAYLPYVNDSHK